MKQALMHNIPKNTGFTVRKHWSDPRLVEFDVAAYTASDLVAIPDSGALFS